MPCSSKLDREDPDELLDIEAGADGEPWPEGEGDMSVDLARSAADNESKNRCGMSLFGVSAPLEQDELFGPGRSIRSSESAPGGENQTMLFQTFGSSDPNGLIEKRRAYRILTAKKE